MSGDTWQFAVGALEACGHLTPDQLSSQALAALDLYSQGLLAKWEFVRGFAAEPIADRRMGVVGWCVTEQFEKLWQLRAQEPAI